MENEIEKLNKNLENMISKHAKCEDELRKKIRKIKEDEFKNTLYPMVSNLIGKFVKHESNNYIKYSRINNVTFDESNTSVNIDRTSFRVELGNYKDKGNKSLTVSNYFDIYDIKCYDGLNILLNSIKVISKEEFNNGFLKLTKEFEDIVIKK
jgi:hypothetical protein